MEDLGDLEQGRRQGMKEDSCPYLGILSPVLSLQCEQEPLLSTLQVHCLIQSSLSPHKGSR